jgi:hypothetical protein
MTHDEPIEWCISLLLVLLQGAYRMTRGGGRSPDLEVNVVRHLLKTLYSGIAGPDVYIEALFTRNEAGTKVYSAAIDMIYL